MAIIRAEIEGEGARPLLGIVEGRPDLDDAGMWALRLIAAGDRLAAAIRGVGRIDTPGAPFPFVGTAVAVASRLAVTTNYTGEALANRARELSSDQPLALLDFATEPPGEECRIAVERVEMIHPHWKSAFLVLAEDVPADRIVELASDVRGADLVGREICVIGYPSEDPRNDPEVTKSIFRGPRDVKRVMPGLITGWGPSEGIEPTQMIVHDCSTTGGTGGAPLIDLEDGRVLGLQHSGKYMVRNWAAPGWELTRDPQWARLWDKTPDAGPGDSAERSARALGVKAAERPAAIFSHPRLLALVDLLVAGGFDGLDDVSALLIGLPPELLANLPQPDSPRARLTACLADLNRMGFPVGDQVPIHYVLINAAHLRSYDPGFKDTLAPFLAETAGFGG